jgi:hypothetical protein
MESTTKVSLHYRIVESNFEMRLGVAQMQESRLGPLHLHGALFATPHVVL